MPITESSVVVATGQKVDNTEVTTSQGVVERQVILHGDPQDPNGRAGVVNAQPDPSAYGSVVRQAPPNVDTGPVLLTTGFTQPLLATFRATHLWFSNQTDGVVTVSVTDGNDVPYMSLAPLQPRQFWPVPFGGAKLTNGLKWQCDTAAAVYAQCVGDL